MRVIVKFVLLVYTTWIVSNGEKKSETTPRVLTARLAAKLTRYAVNPQMRKRATTTTRARKSTAARGKCAKR